MTTIGPSFRIIGDITSQEDMTVQGRVDGQIQMQDGVLLIEAAGHVDGNVEGSAVLIQGVLAGSVVAADRIELDVTAAVTGTLTTTSLVLADGAVFNGTIDMQLMVGETRPVRASSDVTARKTT